MLDVEVSVGGDSLVGCKGVMELWTGGDGT